MPPKRRDITGYSSYFTVKIPGAQAQATFILFLGIFAGAIASLIVHYGNSTGRVELAFVGACAGILIISVPAFLTVLILRMTKRKMKMKHAMFAVLAISLPYAIFIMFNAILYDILRNDALSYVLLILSNAAIYGYWFIINRVAVGQKRSAIITSDIQPLLNILMYLPFGGYLLGLGVSINVALIKLSAGIGVFLVMGYVILYLLDRPAKKNLYVSSVQIFSSMIGQWLYDLNADTKILGSGGVERDVKVDVVAFSSKKGLKAVIVKPDIHYGPFGSVGGSVFTETLGNAIVNKYGATPFIIHGAVNIDDNPISTRQVGTLSTRVCEYVDELGKGRKYTAQGYVGFGSEGTCKAINLRINDVNLLTLTRAPNVTEDIDREIGLHFERFANQDKYKTILVDAHNSRFETAPVDDLRGLYKGSRYVIMYQKAIAQAIDIKNNKPLKFGVSHLKLSKVLKNPDLGMGYSSLGIFDFGRKRFGIIYIDANNMLPGFRESIIEHVKKKYNIDVELCTTDTHSVNSIALSARNALGRHTKPTDMEPLIDTMMERALKNMEPVKTASGSFVFKRFKVWGENAEELITKVGLDIIHIGKYVIPFIIVAAFIIAGWVIYIV